MDDAPFQTPSNLHNLAIEAALDSEWEEALKLNRQIIKNEPNCVDALNRLARAYFELGNISAAKKYYSEALLIDTYNPIAIKNLKIIQASKKNGNAHKPSNNHQTRVSPSLFLQEPGKTKVVNLLKVAEPQRLSYVFCGMPVDLVTKNRGLAVTDQSGNYLGVLPDDISHRILRLIRGGNKYSTCVKSVKVNGLSVLIREIFRSSKFRNQPSFLDSTSVHIQNKTIAPLTLKENADEEIMLEEE